MGSNEFTVTHSAAYCILNTSHSYCFALRNKLLSKQVTNIASSTRECENELQQFHSCTVLKDINY